MPRRGRPPRAGKRATERIELVLTLDEMRAVRALAAATSHLPLADLLRLALLDMAADVGDEAPITMGHALRARLAELLPVRNPGKSDHHVQE